MVEALLYLPMNICKVLLYPMDPHTSSEDTWIHGDKTNHFGSFWLISNRNAVASAHVLRRLEGRFQAALLDMSGQLIYWMDFRLAGQCLTPSVYRLHIDSVYVFFVYTISLPTCFCVSIISIDN